MIVLLLLAQAVQVPQTVQRLADFNVLIGSCEQFIPKRDLQQINNLARDASPEAKAAIAAWREEGKQARLARPHVYNRRVCMGLFEYIR